MFFIIQTSTKHFQIYCTLTYFIKIGACVDSLGAHVLYPFRCKNYMLLIVILNFFNDYNGSKFVIMININILHLSVM